MEDESDIYNLFSQKQRNHGKFSPDYLAFNVYLQEFASRVRYICNLQATGNLSVEDSYKQIEEIWQELERSYLELRMGLSLDENL